MKRSEALKIRRNLETSVQSLDDDTALEMRTFYSTWEAGQAYTEGYKLQYGDRLFKVVMAHTSQADWTPDVAVTLYTVIDEQHDGSKYDPIPYSGNMVLSEGLYYVQDGATYLCVRDTGIPVYNALSELVGLYVEVVQ